MSLSNDDVLAILALLDASHFDELRLETTEYKLHLRRSAAPAPAPALESPPLRPVAEPPAVPARDLNDGATVAVTAPLLGTFYGAPQPGAAPFVTVGSTVEESTVIGIVEVMKLMNSVCAGVRGVVVEIVAKDGRLVEYGEPLIRVASSSA